MALTSALGSNLVNMLYVLDEPSVGLHMQDTARLVKAIQGLRDRGNTVIVVEHEEEMIRAADMVVEIGPGGRRTRGQGRLSRDAARNGREYRQPDRRLPVGPAGVSSARKAARARTTAGFAWPERGATICKTCRSIFRSVCCAS